MRNVSGLRRPPLAFLRPVWALALALGISCANPAARQASPRTKLVEEGSLALCMSRTQPSSRRIVTSRSTLPVEVYIDPALADLRSVREVSIWEVGDDGVTWDRLGSGPAGAPVEIAPGDGLHGLRASVRLEDGKEKLAPLPGDEPALWVRVDALPPSLVWIAPGPNLSLRGVGSIDLEWAANEAQFGDSPCLLEWSEDGGGTWSPIAAVPARAGHQKHRWRVPPMLGGDGILVRVACADMTGKEAAATLALLYPRLEDGGPALVSAEPAGVEARDAGEASPAPAVAAESAVGVATTAAAEAEPEPGTGTGNGDGDGDGETTSLQPPAASLPTHRLQVRAFPRQFLQGGETVDVSFACDPPLPTPLDPRGVLEWSDDGGATWTSAAEVRLAEGKAAWTAPARSGRGCLLRVRAEPESGAVFASEPSTPFSVDGDPPRVELAEIPAVLGARARVLASVEDGGGSGVARVKVLAREKGGAWKTVPHEVVGNGSLEMDLSAAAETEHEVFLQAVDGAGNESPAPPAGADLAAGARRFRLDRTPPLLVARAGPLAWVAGFGGEARVEANWSDALPPLTVEGRAADGSWVETGRWAGLAPGQERFEFDVPVGSREYAVRFSLGDAAGNRAYAIVGPREVESSIRIASLADGRTYPARGVEKIRWTLHPTASERAADLRVTVLHLPRPAGDWAVLYEDLPAASECYWELPGGDAEEHRLLVRLLRAGKVAGEDVSPPFRIGGHAGPEPTVVRILDESLYYSNAARAGMERYLAARGAPDASAAELENLGGEVAQDYRKALELDPRNYHASYGLAQFLNRLDAAGNAAPVAELLERTIAVKPDHVWALNDLGAMRIQGGDFTRAEEALARSAAIEASPIVLYNLGLALFYGGKHGEARGRFEEALHRRGARPVPEGEVYYYLVHSYLQEGDGNRARALFREKEKLIPADLRAGLEKALGG